MKRHDGYYRRMALPALIITTVVFIMPVGAVLLRAFSSESDLLETFTDSYTWRLLAFTVWESFLSALLSVLLAPEEQRIQAVLRIEALSCIIRDGLEDTDLAVESGLLIHAVDKIIDKSSQEIAFTELKNALRSVLEQVFIEIHLFQCGIA